MAIKLLAATNDGVGTGRIYLGGAGGPSTVLEVHSDSLVMDRVHINPFAPTKMVVVGHNSLWRSVNDGVTWTNTAFATIGRIRQIQWVSATKLYLCSGTHIFVSTDSGATLIGVVLPPFNGDSIMDMHWATDTVGYAITNDLSGGGFLYYTIDGGTTWEEYSLSAMAAWDSSGLDTEAPRRVYVSRYDGVAQNRVHVLTSHQVHKLEHPPAAIGLTPTVTLQWNYEPVVILQFPGYGTTGYSGGVDYNTRFDDIKFISGRVWLGGFNTLRGHSFDQLSWYITEYSSSAPGTDYYTHSPLDFGRVFAGSSQSSALVLPARPGLSFSTNGGLSLSPYLQFPVDESLVHQDAFEEADDSGCTDPDACNYEEDLELDNGTCMMAVQLRNCSTNAVIHSDNPAIVELGCRGPRFAIDFGALDPAEENITIQVFINGSLAFNYTANIPTTGFPIDRLTTFLQGFVAYINTVSGFRARRIVPNTSNPIMPGSDFGVWITSIDPNNAGLATSQVLTNVTAGISAAFDEGNSGQVISVAQYPDACFTVCGQGNCAQVQTLDLVSVFPDCVSCQIRPSGRICLDCSSQVYLGSTALVANGNPATPNCVYGGDTLSIALRTTFPIRTQDSFAVVGGGECGDCPLTIQLQGDKTLFFPVGSSFNGGGYYYTVASVSYDADTDVTTFSSAEVCQGDAAVVAVKPFVGCDCNVRVLLEQWNGLVWSSITDETWPCIDNRVYADVNVLIPEQGTYRLSIIASDCAEQRLCVYNLGSCGQYTIAELGCHEFEVRSGRPLIGNGDNHVVITDIGTNEVLLDVQVPVIAMPFRFTNDKDTVYKVEITGPDAVVWATEVIDLCDLQACQTKLTTDLFCAEDPCGKTMTAQEELSRTELIRIDLVISQLEREVFGYRYRYTGLYNYSTQRMLDLNKIAALVKTSQKLSERCAECTKSSAPCLDCP